MEFVKMMMLRLARRNLRQEEVHLDTLCEHLPHLHASLCVLQHVTHLVELNTTRERNIYMNSFPTSHHHQTDCTSNQRLSFSATVSDVNLVHDIPVSHHRIVIPSRPPTFTLVMAEWWLLIVCGTEFLPLDALVIPLYSPTCLALIAQPQAHQISSSNWFSNW